MFTYIHILFFKKKNTETISICSSRKILIDEFILSNNHSRQLSLLQQNIVALSNMDSTTDVIMKTKIFGRAEITEG